MNQSKLNQSIKLLMLCNIGFLMAFGIATAQVDKNSNLYKELMAKDSILFKIGFNKCEIDKNSEIIAEDLEFYHDKGGVTNSKTEFIEVMKNGLCNPNNTEKTYRFLVEGSIDIFPMFNNGVLYGALQNGKHFFSPNPSMTYEKTDTYAFFSHLWIIEDEDWKLKRVISYNHVSKPVNKSIKTIPISQNILESYTGTYLTKNGEATISIQDNRLLLEAGKMTEMLETVSEVLFEHPKAPLTFEFVKNEKGLVSKILVRENGKIVEEVVKQ